MHPHWCYHGRIKIVTHNNGVFKVCAERYHEKIICNDSGVATMLFGHEIPFNEDSDAFTDKSIIRLSNHIFSLLREPSNDGINPTDEVQGLIQLLQALVSASPLNRANTAVANYFSEYIKKTKKKQGPEFEHYRQKALTACIEKIYYDGTPIRPRIATAIAAVVGAVFGAVVGAVIGFVMTTPLGGIGAFPGFMVGAIKGANVAMVGVLISSSFFAGVLPYLLTGKDRQKTNAFYQESPQPLSFFKKKETADYQHYRNELLKCYKNRSKLEVDNASNDVFHKVKSVASK